VIENTTRYLNHVIQRSSNFLSVAILIALIATSFPLSASAQRQTIDQQRFELVDRVIEADIAAGKLPGAVVLVGRGDRILFRKAYGKKALSPDSEMMTPDTVFDVASLTKVVATSSSIMVLLEEGNIRLADNIGKFIPEIEDASAKRATIQQLLNHVAGYQPDFDLGEKWQGRDGMLAALYKERLRHSPGSRFVYSDIGFIVLGEIVHRVSGMPLDEFFEKRVASKLGMKDSRFERLDDRGNRVGSNPPVQRIAPTENVRGQLSYLGSTFEGSEEAGKRVLRGEVHDPTAFRMNGVAGHAGLFSTADDLARFSRMIVRGGVLDGRRFMAPSVLNRMTAPTVVTEDGATRGLGWDVSSTFSSNRGDFFPIGSFGHTGFTGTSIWIDPVSETFVVFLSNRVHPDGKGDVGPLRGRVSSLFSAAVSDVPPSRYRQFEAEHFSMVAAQLPRFRDLAESARRNAGINQVTASVQRSTLNGIDVLEQESFRTLDGMRIGLVTNHTGRSRDGRPTIDVLFEASNVKLVSLFAPEHGIRGELDQERIDDSTDEKTGLRIFSLYGETRRPKQEQLVDLDAVVFDIQDIGTRFYTYISTLQNVMEEVAKVGKPIFVLDRPNPINGNDIEGPIADSDKLSFVATHTIPVRHGMTVGELALMMNQEKKIGADVRVVRMRDWQRGDWFDQTGQSWVNPSPNMRSLTQASLYPGVGLLEFTNLSVGRGTDTPFEVVGAPWLDGRKLATYLNARNIPGVRFVPIRFTPNASVFKGEECGGINIVITDRRAFRAVATGVEIAVALRILHSEEWKYDRYLRLVVNQEAYSRIVEMEDPKSIVSSWQKSLLDFSSRRTAFLLY
jgi:uncharacterized protein YbbC (DUF1343 family)/CubicO group peptidase (beta-lactamase class C family)